MTGGMAFVYDPEQVLEARINPEHVLWQRLAHPHWEEVVRGLVARHAAETNSRYAASLLNDWAREKGHFWQIVPKDYVKYLPVPLVAEPALAAAGD
jgi:glutamate synthase (NADPH/NADH) large chain